MNIFKNFLSVFKEDTIPPKSKEAENKEIIDIYNRIKRAVPGYNEPNYKLAEKVFREFNDFNLKNINEIHHMYLEYIPQCFLPYPKNYIKCAYYLFLEKAKKEKDLRMFNLIQEVGSGLWFGDYPNYEEYKKNLTRKNDKNENIKKWYDEKVFDDYDPKPKELFKKMYGVYEISEEDYNSYPNSIDATNEKLIHDFGVLPEIEEDVDMDKIRKNK